MSTSDNDDKLSTSETKTELNHVCEARQFDQRESLDDISDDAVFDVEGYQLPSFEHVQPQQTETVECVERSSDAHDESNNTPAETAAVESLEISLDVSGNSEYTNDMTDFETEMNATITQTEAMVLQQTAQNTDSDHHDEEDPYYAPPPDHITGEVGDLARLTNLNKDTLLQELRVCLKYNKASLSIEFSAVLTYSMFLIS